MATGKLTAKKSYKNTTIFVYRGSNGTVYYMLPAGLSSHKYKTLAAAQAAIDRGTARKKRAKKGR